MVIAKQYNMASLESIKACQQRKEVINMTTKRKNVILKELKIMAINGLIGLGFIGIFALGLWLESQRYVNFW